MTLAACPCLTGPLIVRAGACRDIHTSLVQQTHCHHAHGMYACRPRRPAQPLSLLIRRCRRLDVSKAAPPWNPQNVPDPQVMPQKEFGPEETVRAQLDALQNNDNPWPNHGLQTAYEFGEDIGGMERSRYFGYSKDLYHFDHFLGQFQNEFSELTNLASYTVLQTKEEENGDYTVDVEVQSRSRVSQLQFLLRRKDIGRKKGCLMTKTLRRLK